MNSTEKEFENIMDKIKINAEKIGNYTNKLLNFVLSKIGLVIFVMLIGTVVFISTFAQNAFKRK